MFLPYFNPQSNLARLHRLRTNSQSKIYLEAKVCVWGGDKIQSFPVVVRRSS